MKIIESPKNWFGAPLGRPGPLKGQNFKIFVFGRRDFIFAWYVAFDVRKSLSPQKFGLGPLWTAQGPHLVSMVQSGTILVTTV